MVVVAAIIYKHIQQSLYCTCVVAIMKTSQFLRLFFFPRLLDDGDILPGQVADAVEILVRDGFGLDELAANAQAAGAGLEEVGRRVQAARPASGSRMVPAPRRMRSPNACRT